MTKSQIISIIFIILLVCTGLGIYFVNDAQKLKEKNERLAEIDNQLYTKCLYIKGDFAYDNKKVEITNETYDKLQLVIDVAFYNYKNSGAMIDVDTLYQEYDNFRAGKNDDTYQGLKKYQEYMSDREVDRGLFASGLYSILPSDVIIYDLTFEQLDAYIAEYLVTLK